MDTDKWKGLGIDPEKLQIMDPEKREFFWACMEEYVRIIRIFYSEEAREYFHNLVAALMLEYNAANPNDKITIYYRMKSCKSIFDKLVDHFSRDDLDRESPKCVYGVDSKNPSKPRLFQEISDIFGMTIVYESGEEIHYSPIAVLQTLATERDKNRRLIPKMQEFKVRNTPNEFRSSQNPPYSYKDSRQAYYLNCILLIERIKSLIAPEATDLLAKYNKKLDKIKSVVPEVFFEAVELAISDDDFFECLDPLKEIESLFGESEMTTEEKRRMQENFSDKDVSVVSFCKLYNDFISRIPDKIDLETLNRRFVSLFEEENKSLGILKKFEIRFSKYSLDQKRRKNGFVSDFYRIKTPFGDIEVQLQPKHEYEEACRGYSAHSAMEGKNIALQPIPDLDDEKGLKAFREWARFCSPQKSRATLTPEVKGRVTTVISGPYENLMLLLTQVERGKPLSEIIERYCAEMYDKKEKLFPGQHIEDHQEGFTINNVIKYSERKPWKDFLEASELRLKEIEAQMAARVSEMEKNELE